MDTFLSYAKYQQLQQLVKLLKKATIVAFSNKKDIRRGAKVDLKHVGSSINICFSAFKTTPVVKIISLNFKRCLGGFVQVL